MKGRDEVKVLDLKNASERGRNGDGIIINKSNKGSAITHQEQQDSKAALLLLSGHVSVSWHVPVKNKYKNKNKKNNNNHASTPPGIFSDYSQPRTRTPSHN